MQKGLQCRNIQVMIGDREMTLLCCHEMWLSQLQLASCSSIRKENQVSFVENLLNTDQERGILESGSIKSVLICFSQTSIFLNILFLNFVTPSSNVLVKTRCRWGRELDLVNIDLSILFLTFKKLIFLYFLVFNKQEKQSFTKF